MSGSCAIRRLPLILAFRNLLRVPHRASRYKPHAPAIHAALGILLGPGRLLGDPLCFSPRLTALVSRTLCPAPPPRLHNFVEY